MPINRHLTIIDVDNPSNSIGGSNNAIFSVEETGAVITLNTVAALSIEKRANAEQPYVWAAFTSITGLSIEIPPTPAVYRITGAVATPGLIVSFDETDEVIEEDDPPLYEATDEFNPVLGQTVFALSNLPTDATSLRVEVNGVAYRAPSDVSVSGTLVTWTHPSFIIEPTDRVVVLYH